MTMLRPDTLAMAMLTAPRPQPTIHATIGGLRRAGFGGPLHLFAEPAAETTRRPGVILHRNPRQLRMWPNWRQAAEFLLYETTAPYLLLLEDDFEAGPDSSARLQELLDRVRPDEFGLASLYTSQSTAPRSLAANGWFPLGPRNYAWGSLAYCFSRRSLAELLATRVVKEHAGDRDTDSIVTLALRETGRTAFCHAPSLVLHTGGENSSVGHCNGGPESALLGDPASNGNGHHLKSPPTTPSKVCLLMPYFGAWPEWFDLFLESCQWNGHVDWLFFTDLPLPKRVPPNVRFVHTSLRDLQRFAEERLGSEVALDEPYKLCDLRPCFGRVFADYLDGYEFFGWGDLDVIYGDLARGVPSAAWRRDVISFHGDRISGHFCLFRNTEAIRRLYEEMPRWREQLADPAWRGLDDQLQHVAQSKTAFYHESFNTPHVPEIRWTDGSTRYPREWIWRDGRLQNDLDGEREFPYFHFMVWKGGRWGRMHGGGQWERLERPLRAEPDRLRRGWTISERGFDLLPAAEPNGHANGAPSANGAAIPLALPPVQSLWIGPRLTRLEQLCVASFLEQGHPFHLYTYETVRDVPAGAIVRDAAEIVPRDELLDTAQGRLSAASNIFRYKLLERLGGWWVDMDLLCARPFPFVDQHLFAWEDDRHVNCAVIHAPLASRLMTDAWQRACQPDIAPDPAAGGPGLVTKLLRERAMFDVALPPLSFYPIGWPDFRELLRPWRPMPHGCYAVHAWREMWSQAGLDTDGPFPPTSVIGQFEQRLAHRLP